jgi:adenylate cyclase
MPTLIAQGPQPRDRWSQALIAGEKQLVGRETGWQTPWDREISRRHVEVLLRDGKLEVVALRGAKNPVFFKGETNDSFTIAPGEYFIVGSTTFSLMDDQLAMTCQLPTPQHERKFASEELRRQPFRDPQRRLDQLEQLPNTVENATSDYELRTRLLNLVMAGVGGALAAAIVRVKVKIKPETDLDATDFSSITEVLNSELHGKYASGFPISAKLVFDTFRSGASGYYVWSGKLAGIGSTTFTGDYTLAPDVDWAFCVPWSARGSDQWALYVAGQFNPQEQTTEKEDLETIGDDLKFAQILVHFASTLLDLQRLKVLQVQLDRFFSPRVRRLLQQAADQGGLNEMLAPSEQSVTVMLCDLRGFSAEVESAGFDRPQGVRNPSIVTSKENDEHPEQEDPLHRMFNRVSRSLEIMTTAIIDNDGVVSDFQGDNAMGFWGWPALEGALEGHAVLRACEAALSIRAKMGLPGRERGREDTTFSAGVGIASGNALAGIIGTVAQGKIGVFGPVVNRAARLETLTKQLKAPVIIDDTTARTVIEHNQQRLAQQRPLEMRVRRLGKFRLVGFRKAVEVYELLPAESDGELSDAELSCFAAALSQLEGGEWRQAKGGFSELVRRDAVAGYFFSMIIQHNDTPPDGWDGIVRLDRK